MNIDEIYEPISQELSKVETKISSIIHGLEIFQTPVQYPSDGIISVQEIIDYFFKVPGKRFRPALVLLSAKASQSLILAPGSLMLDPESRIQNPASSSQILNLATAIELIHSASLIHDDIIDESDVRRNQTTLNKKFGNKSAVIAGDMLYAKAFSLLVKIGRNDIVDIMCRTTQEMCVGEISGQQLMEAEQQVSLREYLKMIENKTASFMSACCRCGALLSLPADSTDEELIQSIADYGFNLGMIYQIIDDYIDEDFINVKKPAFTNIEKFALGVKRSLEVLNDSIYKEKLADLVDHIVSNYSEPFYREVTGRRDV